MIIKKKNDINIIGDAMIKKILLLTSLFVFGICSLTLAEEIKVSKKENIDKSKDLDISFTKVILNNEDITNTSIEEDGKTIIFVINNLSKMKDNSLVYTISNHADKDLNIKITCTNTKQYSDYYTFTNTYESKVLKDQTIDGTISITLNKMAEKEIKEIFMCKLSYTV